MKLAYIDVETTGLSANKNFIHQLAMIIEIDGEVVEELNLKVKPPTGAIINKKALEIGGVTIDDLRQYPEYDEQYKVFVDTLGKHVDKYDKQDKYHFVAYNAHFDNSFVRAFMSACGDNYFGSWFRSNNIDVMVVAGQTLKEERHLMKNFKLATVVEHLKIGVQGDVHDALHDIRLTRELYKQVK